MGNSEEVKPSKPEKSPSPSMDQNNMHVYPDWATMQAFYGARFAVPPYMNSSVASPHYMWAPPQSMMPPYAAFYPHGGVYTHPGVPLAATALTTGDADAGFVKKSAMAIGSGDGNDDSTDPGTEHRLSGSDETNGSSDESNRVTSRADQNGKKRSRQGSPNKGDSKAHKKTSVGPSVNVRGDSEKTMDVIPVSSDTPVKTAENTNTAFELKNVKSNLSNVPLQLVTNRAWVQDDRELKREKRKQSNRESARRSRLRKQAETEELLVKVQALTAENTTLKSELNKLTESSEQLKLENAALIGKVNAGHRVQTKSIHLVKIDDERVKVKPFGTVNLLARVDSNLTNGRTTTEDGDPHENRSPRAKLRQLLDAGSRTDAVVAR